MKEKGLLPRYKLSERSVVYLVQIAERTAWADGKKFRMSAEQLGKLAADYLLCIRQVPETSVDEVGQILQGVTLENFSEDQIQLVRGAANVFRQLSGMNPYKEADLLRVHRMLWQGIAPQAGMLRTEKSGSVFAAGGRYATPSAKRLPKSLAALLKWGEMGKQSPAHPLVQAVVMNYALEILQPFSYNTRSVSLLWMWMILVKWRPVFIKLPILQYISRERAAYDAALLRAVSADRADEFVEFLLELIQKAVVDSAWCGEVPQKKAESAANGKKAVRAGSQRKPDQPGEAVVADGTGDAARDERPQAVLSVPGMTPSVQALLRVLGEKMLTTRELMEGLGLKHRPSFRNNYLLPALEMGLVEMTIPDKPNSCRQKYRCRVKEQEN